MLPRLHVAVPRAKEQLTAVQHLLIVVGYWLAPTAPSIVGCWAQRPRQAARHHSRHALLLDRPRAAHSTSSLSSKSNLLNPVD